MNATSLTRVASTRETIMTAQIDLVQSTFAMAAFEPMSFFATATGM